jgi:hypothetical protein
MFTDVLEVFAASIIRAIRPETCGWLIQGSQKIGFMFSFTCLPEDGGRIQLSKRGFKTL